MCTYLVTHVCGRGRCPHVPSWALTWIVCMFYVCVACVMCLCVVLTRNAHDLLTGDFLVICFLFCPLGR